MHSSSAAMMHKKGHKVYMKEALHASPARLKTIWIWKATLGKNAITCIMLPERCNTRILLMFAQYTFIYNPVILSIPLYSEEAGICEEFFLQMCVHIERVRWPDCLTVSCGPLKKPKAMSPLFFSSLGADTDQTNPCDYVPRREPVCLHVQMYCLSHGHTCV